jgi:AcrR family transcriptional regulator
MTPTGASFVPARPSLRHLRRDRTRDEIAHAALELIARKGYGDTLVEEIAEAALISPRTFYRYFPAKEDAFFHGLPAFEKSLAKVPPASGDVPNLGVALRAAGAAFCAAVREDRDDILPRLPHALNEPALLGQMAYRLHAAEARLARRIQPHLSTGVGRAWTAEVLAAAVTASLVAALRRWQKAPKSNDLTDLVDRAMAMLHPAFAPLDRN